jgi:hypothetical protein
MHRNVGRRRGARTTMAVVRIAMPALAAPAPTVAVRAVRVMHRVPAQTVAIARMVATVTPRAAASAVMLTATRPATDIRHATAMRLATAKLATVTRRSRGATGHVKASSPRAIAVIVRRTSRTAMAQSATVVAKAALVTSRARIATPAGASHMASLMARHLAKGRAPARHTPGPASAAVTARVAAAQPAKI